MYSCLHAYIQKYITYRWSRFATTCVKAVTMACFIFSCNKVGYSVSETVTIMLGSTILFTAR